MKASDVITHLKSLAVEEDAVQLQRYFKTGPGEYGEGDIFIGVRVPVIRKQLRKFQELSLKDTETLLHSEFHEVRLFALLMMVEKFKKGDESLRKEILSLYLENTDRVNNWDLVDSSAHKMLGPWLEKRDRTILTELAHSELIWERRIAIMTTLHFITNDDFHNTLEIASILLEDKEDLIHKAVGWMLREVGNRNKEVETTFLVEHYHKMPRTMLRYAIEKFPKEERQAYLKGTI